MTSVHTNATPDERNWPKNVLFFGLLLLGTAILFQQLMSADGIATPRSYAPQGSEQDSIRRTAARVDDAFRQQWAERKVALEVAGTADELTVARRLALGLAGTLPSLQEIREFEKQPADSRIHWWVSRLLEDQRASNHLAERLARSLVGVDEGPFVLFRRRRFVDWLSERLRQNTPYDQLATSILTEAGLWTDSPAVNFYTKTIAEEAIDPIVLAGKTSRAFLGMRIDCLQCHDDFLGTINLGTTKSPTGGLQTDFHSLAAFFGDVESSIFGVRDNPDKPDYQYRLLDDEEPTTIAPQVPFNRQLVGSEENLRQRLANWITHKENRPFARAAINRMWAIMCGRPLIEPIDDIPLAGPFPAALEALVDDFVKHEFDLHRLIRVISETEAFQRASTAEFEITGEHEDAWCVFPVRRLRPDQVAGAIVQSTSLTAIDSTAHIVSRLLKFGQQNDFVQRFGDAGENEFAERSETVTQRLLMLNGQMINERINAGLSSTVRIASLSPTIEKGVESVYLATLCRRPDAEEISYFRERIEPLNKEEQNTRFLDLYWTLINSLEFAWNH